MYWVKHTWLATSYRSVSWQCLCLYTCADGRREAPFSGLRLGCDDVWNLPPSLTRELWLGVTTAGFPGHHIYMCIYFLPWLKMCCFFFYFISILCTAALKWRDFERNRAREACETSLAAFFSPCLKDSNNHNSALALCDESALKSTCFLKCAVSLPETAQPLLSVPSCSSERALPFSLVPDSPA